MITTPQLATVFRVSDRLLVSVAHPFEGIVSFELVSADGSKLEADLIALIPEKDLSLLWLREPSDLPALRLASEEVKPDVPVNLFHYDNEGQLFVNDGTVLRRADVTLDGEDERRSIQLEAEIVAGDSGSPVVDPATGDAVGVVFAAARGATTGWAVSVPEIRAAIEQLDAQPEPR